MASDVGNVPCIEDIVENPLATVVTLTTFPLETSAVKSDNALTAPLKAVATASLLPALEISTTTAVPSTPVGAESGPPLNQTLYLVVPLYSFT